MEGGRSAQSAQRRPGESQTGAAVAGENDHDAGLGVASTGDGPLGLRRATPKTKAKKCKDQGPRTDTNDTYVSKRLGY
jgi:hypothetical protein